MILIWAGGLDFGFYSISPKVKKSEPDIHFEIECCLLKYIILHRVLEMDGFAVTLVWAQVVIWDTYSISPISEAERARYHPDLLDWEGDVACDARFTVSSEKH